MRKLLFWVPVLAAVACREPQPPVPPDQMAALLADMHLAEVRSTQVPSDSTRGAGERNLDTLAVWYRSVWQHYGLTQAQFLSTMSWYENHPVALDSVYRNSVRNIEGMIADTARK